jgi:hypothetical protein
MELMPSKCISLRAALILPSQLKLKLRRHILQQIFWCRKHYATSRKVAVSRPDKVNDLFHYIILPDGLHPEVYPVLKRNEYKKQKEMFLWSRARPVRKADNPTAICEPSV